VRGEGGTGALAATAGTVCRDLPAPRKREPPLPTPTPAPRQPPIGSTAAGDSMRPAPLTGTSPIGQQDPLQQGFLRQGPLRQGVLQAAGALPRPHPDAEGRWWGPPAWPLAAWPRISAARPPPVGAAQTPAHDRKRIAPNIPSKRTHPPGIRPDSAVEPAARSPPQIGVGPGPEARARDGAASSVLSNPETATQPGNRHPTRISAVGRAEDRRSCSGGRLPLTGSAHGFTGSCRGAPGRAVRAAPCRTSAAAVRPPGPVEKEARRPP
jgi:hypothetical protein